MQHLTAEALARLVDEPPEPGEAAHVRDCLFCRRELEEMRAQTGALAALDDFDPPPHGWVELEARLRAEGLVRDGAPARMVFLGRPGLRAAAAIALFLLGGMTGVAAWSRWAGSDSPSTDGDPATLPASTAYVPATDVADYPGPMEEPVLIVEDALPAPASPLARLASDGAAPPARTRMPAPVRRAPASPVVTQAQRELAEAEAQYVTALQRYADLVNEAGTDPVARLAALERLVEVTREALDRSPADPVINGYHLAAVRERDEVRRQIVQASNENWF